MRVPILRYRVTVDGQHVATFAAEPAAARFTGDLAELVARHAGTLAGPVGFQREQEIVEVESVAEVGDQLDTVTLARAFDAQEAEKAVAAAAAVAEVTP